MRREVDFDALGEIERDAVAPWKEEVLGERQDAGMRDQLGRKGERRSSAPKLPVRAP